MSQSKFTVIKKKRKYFEAKFTTGSQAPFDLVIDENSEKLALGEEIELPLEDLSVRSKYGTKLIFALQGSAEETGLLNGVCFIKPEVFNSVFSQLCRDLNGKWDGEEKVWAFPMAVEDKVEELDEKYNSNFVIAQITFNEEMHQTCNSLELCGIRIATAWGRDSGAKWGVDVMGIEGGCTSGGSVKNWRTVVREDAVIRVKTSLFVAEQIAEEYKDELTVNIIR